MSMPPGHSWRLLFSQHGRLFAAVRGHARALARDAWTATALLLALAVVLGVLAGTGNLTLPPPLLIATVIFGLAVATAGRHRRALWLPALLLAALALGLWRVEAARPPTGPAGLPFYTNAYVTLTGTVSAIPEPLDRSENVRVSVDTLVPATVPGARPRRVNGAVLVHLGAVAALSYGDRVRLDGALAAPPDLPGAAPGSYRAYLAAQGIYAVMNYPRLRRLGDGGNPLLRLAALVRGLVVAGITHSLPEPERALLIGILVGTRTRALGALTAPFIATGMIHVVAIDGFKVTIVVGTAYALARRFLGLRYALFPALAVLLAYVLLTGATPAGLRAGLMWALALVALRFGRRSDAATSLGLTAAVLALISPRILSDLGFQLSLSGTAAIVLLVPAIERGLHRLPAIVRETAAVTLAVQIGAMPVLAGGIGQVSLVAPLANALLLPLLAPIMALGALVAVAGAALPALGAALGLAVYPLLALMVAGPEALARLPFASVPAGQWPLPLMLAYYLLVGLAARYRPRATTTVAATPGASPAKAASVTPVAATARAMGVPVALMRASKLRLLALCGGCVVLFAATVAWQAPRPVYTLAMLPLGDEQGLLLATPTGRTLLIDGGNAPSQLDAALGAHLPFWNSHLDVVALTGTGPADVDGLRDLLDRYGVGRALDPGAVYPTASYARWRAALRDVDIPEAKLRAGRRYRLDQGAYLDALLPSALNPDAPDTPVALRLVLGHISVLLLSSSAFYADPAALTAGGARRDTMLALPAGTDPRDAEALMRRVRPRLVVLPAPGDRHDVPADDARIARAARALGAYTWQTTGANTLEITSNGAHYETRVVAP